MQLTRRSIVAGLIAAPAVVKFASLMPVRGIVAPIEPKPWIGDLEWNASDGLWRFYTGSEWVTAWSEPAAIGGPRFIQMFVPRTALSAASAFVEHN